MVWRILSPSSFDQELAWWSIVGFEDKWGSKYVDGFGQVEEEILDVMDIECFDEVEDHVKDCTQNRDI